MAFSQNCIPKTVSIKARETLLIPVIPCNSKTFEQCYRRHLALIKLVELGKCLTNCQEKNGKKSELNRQKVEGVAKLDMSTPNSNQSKAERFGDHFCEKGIVVA